MPQRQTITSGDWESHKAVLKRLYLNEGKNLREIIAEMGEKYTFWPSKSQYETAFKKWNFRKNLTKSELEFLERRIKRRMADNKETEVYLNDVLIPGKRIKREIDRHFTPCYQQPYTGTAAPSPQTPPDISFRTPADMAVEPHPDILPLDISVQTPQGMDVEPPTDIIPPNIAVRMPQDMDVEPLTDITPLEIAVRTPQDTAIGPPPDIVPLNLVVQIPHDMAVQTPKNPANPEIRLDTLPWFQFQWFLESNAPVIAQIFHTGKCRVRPPLFSFLGMITSKVWALDSFVQQDLSLAQLGSVESFMQAVSLERNRGEIKLSIRKLLGPFNSSALTEFLKYMVYLSSNNILSNEQVDHFLEWVIETNNRPALEAFFSVKIPTISAFARCVFESALRIQDAAVLRALLKAGVDPGRPTRMNGRTPLQVAVEGRSMKLARILLDARVDVNTCTAAFGPRDRQTALSIAVSTEAVEMVQMLLDAGADTEATVLAGCSPSRLPNSKYGTALQRAAFGGNVVLVRLLLGAGADVNARDIASLNCLDGTVLQMVAGRSNHKESIELARLLLGAHANVNGPCSCTNSALWLAALHGDVEIVRMLLDAGAVVNESNVGEWTILMNAAKSGSVETVQMLLDAGADVNAIPIFGRSPSHGHFAPHRCSNALAVAASGNSAEIVQVLLDAGADANIPADSPGYNPLNEAARRGNAEIVRMLLAAGADVNADVSAARALDNFERHLEYPGFQFPDFPYRHEYDTALNMAAHSGSAATVRILLDAGADAHAPTSRGFSILMGPVMGGSVGIVRMLLDAGVDCNPPADSCSYSPLKMAAKCGSTEITRMLLDAGADVNAGTGSSRLFTAVENSEYVDIIDDSRYHNHFNDGFTALQAAAKCGDIEIVRMLLDAGADVRAPENSPLPWAARAKWQLIALVSGLLDDTGLTNISSRDQSTLKIAIQSSHNVLVQALLDAGADVNAMDWYGRTALEVAIETGNDGLAQALLDAGADANAFSPLNWRTALRAAVRKNNTDLVQKLLDAGAKADTAHFPPNNRISDVIPLAAGNGNIKIVELLIHAGADVNASVGFHGTGGIYEDLKSYAIVRRTALMCAAWSGNAKLIKVLLNGGANVNARPEPCFGWTALQAAVIKGHTALAQNLLIAGADANAPAAEERGVTALQAAAIKGYLGIALILIQAGADPNAPPAKHSGRTALEGAAEHGRLDMVEFLLRAGTDIADITRARAFAEKEGHFAIVEFLDRFYHMGAMSPFVS